MLNLQKVTIASLYLEPQQFVWYQWLCECKKNTIIYWSIFIKELIAYHDDVKRNSFFTQLINLWKKGSVIEHIQQFQKLSLRVEGIEDDKVGQGTHEDKNSAHVELPSMNKHDLRGFDSNMGSNQGWSIRGLQLPKIGMRKFDVKDPITWIF